MGGFPRLCNCKKLLQCFLCTPFWELYDTTLKSFVPKNLAALTLPGSLLEMKNLRTHPHPKESEPTF